jgi:iron-sulfur cluster assembly protein
MKIFVDNNITIAVEKNLSLFSWNHIRVSGGINGKGFVFNNPNAVGLVVAERELSLKFRHK